MEKKVNQAIKANEKEVKQTMEKQKVQLNQINDTIIKLQKKIKNFAKNQSKTYKEMLKRELAKNYVNLTLKIQNNTRKIQKLDEDLRKEITKTSKELEQALKKTKENLEKRIDTTNKIVKELRRNLTQLSLKLETEKTRLDARISTLNESYINTTKYAKEERNRIEKKMINEIKKVKQEALKYKKIIEKRMMEMKKEQQKMEIEIKTLLQEQRMELIKALKKLKGETEKNLIGLRKDIVEVEKKLKKDLNKIDEKYKTITQTLNIKIQETKRELTYEITQVNQKIDKIDSKLKKVDDTFDLIKGDIKNLQITTEGLSKNLETVVKEVHNLQKVVKVIIKEIKILKENKEPDFPDWLNAIGEGFIDLVDGGKNLIKEVINTVGDNVAKVGDSAKGIFAGLMKPLIIGGAAIAGVIVLIGSLVLLSKFGKTSNPQFYRTQEIHAITEWMYKGKYANIKEKIYKLRKKGQRMYIWMLILALGAIIVGGIATESLMAINKRGWLTFMVVSVIWGSIIAIYTTLLYLETKNRQMKTQILKYMKEKVESDKQGIFVTSEKKKGKGKKNYRNDNINCNNNSTIMVNYTTSKWGI